MLIGGIEAGGTKFVCAVGDKKGNILEKVSFPTVDPDETILESKNFFNKYSIEALGVGSFGPVDLVKGSSSFGTILNTPKTEWINYPLLKKLKEEFAVPIYIDTDVNATCLGEFKYGVGRDVNSCLYITVGTGIGAGLVVNEEIYQGKNHSEMGHLFLRKHPADNFVGCCPSHGGCLEGLASGTAIEKRYGKKGYLLADDKHVWEIEAYYLAQAITNYFLVLSPEKIIIGGGVMKQDFLYEMIRQQFIEMLGSYLIVEDIDSLIVPPTLQDEQGVKGAIALCL